MKRSGKCLVIQEARFGDLIQTKPLLDSLSKGGTWQRTLLVRPGVLEAARSLGLAEDVRAWPSFGDPGEKRSLVARVARGRDFVAELRRENFDRAVVMNHHGTGIVLARLLGVPVSGFDRMFDPGNARESPSPLSGWPAYLVSSSRGIRAINRIHLSDMWLGFGGGKRETPVAPVRRNREGPVVVVLGGRSPYRRWEKEALAGLLRALPKIDGGPVYLSGGAEDGPLGDSLVRLCGGGIVNMAGRTDIRGLVSLLSSAGVVLSPDTASLHLAASLGIPTVGLFFASALPFETGAYRAGALSLVSSMDCYPCNGEGSDCSHLSCRKQPDPEIVADLVSAVRRGATGNDLALLLRGKLTGAELFEARMTPAGLLQKAITPRLLTRERILAKLLRRFFWRYLEGENSLPDLETELLEEGTEGGLEGGPPAGEGPGGIPWSLWFLRLERGIDLYARLRERELRGSERMRMVDRLASEFPMIWPVLHHLEWVEGGEGPVDRLAGAAGQLVRDIPSGARLVRSERGSATGKQGGVHVAVR